jgi:hypothetical protein
LSGLGQAAQFGEQMDPLAPQHGGQRRRISCLGGGHHLEEEIVAVAAGAHTGLVQPAVEFLPPGLGDLVDQPVRLDGLRLALGLDQAVAGEAVDDLVAIARILPIS